MQSSLVFKQFIQWNMLLFNWLTKSLRKTNLHQVSWLIYLRLSMRKIKNLKKHEKLLNSFRMVVIRSQLYVLLKFPALPRYHVSFITDITLTTLINKIYFLLILLQYQNYATVQKMKFSIKDFFRKCDQILRKLRIWSYLLKKSLMYPLLIFFSLPIFLVLHK